MDERNVSLEADLLTAAVLTADEQAIVRELLSTTRSGSEVIPDDIAPEELWRYLSATCKGVRRVEDAKSRLKFFLGRMLVKLQSHPQLFEAQGYTTFNDFVTYGLEKLFGVSRNEGYVVKRIDEELGRRLTVSQMAEIGISNLSLAATALRQKLDPGTPPEKREAEITRWIDLAKTSTVKEMREVLASDGLVEEGDLEMTVLSLTLRKSVRSRFAEFRKQPWVRAKGGETDSSLLDAMMAEAATWEAEYEQARRG